MHLDGYFCHLEGCDSINFTDKKFRYFITWNENHAYITVWKAKGTVYTVTQTQDNLTQITIPLGTYLHVDWPA